VLRGSKNNGPWHTPRKPCSGEDSLQQWTHNLFLPFVLSELCGCQWIGQGNTDPFLKRLPYIIPVHGATVELGHEVFNCILELRNLALGIAIYCQATPSVTSDSLGFLRVSSSYAVPAVFRTEMEAGMSAVSR
jgi:hypothetical protein